MSDKVKEQVEKLQREAEESGQPVYRVFHEWYKSELRAAVDNGYKADRDFLGKVEYIIEGL